MLNFMAIWQYHAQPWPFRALLINSKVDCLLCFCARLCIVALWSPAGKGLTSWLSFVLYNCVFFYFPIGILGQVWYLIVSIPDLYHFSYVCRFLNMQITYLMKWPDNFILPVRFIDK